MAFIQQPVIQIEDAAGNPISQGGVLVTASVANGPAGASLSNATAITNAGGAANFAGNQTSAGDLVTLTLNPNPFTLTGAGPVAAVNGVATFSSLSVSIVGTGYTLAASAAGLFGSTSSAFDITPCR